MHNLDPKSGGKWELHYIYTFLGVGTCLCDLSIGHNNHRIALWQVLDRVGDKHDRLTSLNEDLINAFFHDTRPHMCIYLLRTILV